MLLNKNKYKNSHIKRRRCQWLSYSKVSTNEHFLIEPNVKNSHMQKYVVTNDLDAQKYLQMNSFE